MITLALMMLASLSAIVLIIWPPVRGRGCFGGSWIHTSGDTTVAIVGGAWEVACVTAFRQRHFEWTREETPTDLPLDVQPELVDPTAEELAMLERLWLLSY
jgi:hypothetical protein